MGLRRAALLLLVGTAACTTTNMYETFVVGDGGAGDNATVPNPSGAEGDGQTADVAADALGPQDSTVRDAMAEEPDGLTPEGGGQDSGSADTATIDAAPDGTTYDAGWDGASDAAANDAGSDGMSDAADAAPFDPDSSVTCTYMLQHQAVSGCETCSLPAELTVTQNNVPVYVGASLPATYCGVPQGSGAVQIAESTGWPYNDTSWTLSDAGGDQACVLNGAVLVPAGTAYVTISVAPNNVTSVNLSLTAHAETTPPCSVLRGCYTESLNCQGSAVARTK